MKSLIVQDLHRFRESNQNHSRRNSISLNAKVPDINKTMPLFPL